jgi:hypothetical protein
MRGNRRQFLPLRTRCVSPGRGSTARVSGWPQRVASAVASAGRLSGSPQRTGGRLREPGGLTAAAGVCRAKQAGCLFRSFKDRKRDIHNACRVWKRFHSIGTMVCELRCRPLHSPFPNLASHVSPLKDRDVCVCVICACVYVGVCVCVRPSF